MVSIVISALGRADLPFIEPGVKENSGGHYCDSFLIQHLLKSIRAY